ncbi:XRE family transcriptional regulator [Apibacter muscae]|uniref:XRE family transcriptional regulator n=1 Tax=Apibacter muscae TaxID=2509004 RepID=A0A563DBC0_9FLAO|nr:helix-turn-helix transcriptional regulator [Apibacter muscae]TWP23139.1 XRE family transcriptional regulator [Apibacter muscae]TWP27074.1 XRE family transcriptional regulator [Apibacter muscae]
MYRIKEICRNKGLMLKDLAEKIGITEVGLSKSLNGNPTLDTLQKIANTLNVHLVDLFINDGVIGFIKSNGRTYEINSFNDLDNVFKTIKKEQEEIK